MSIIGTIERINGSLIVAHFDEEPKIGDLTEVGDLRLMGEIVRLSGETAYIQCFEATSGLRPGEPVADLGVPLVAELGPGLMGRIVDGVERSETELWELTGPFVSRGTNISPLNREAKWRFEAKVKPGDKVEGGNVLGVVQETVSFEHRVLVPLKQSGTIKSIMSGEFTVTDVIGEIATSSGIVPIKMMQTWPVRIPRPIKERLPLEMPLMTGQRVIDTFFPVAKGGAAAIPGGFGTGKTVTLQQVAKWSDADIIIYIGCGERGNEMADVVAHFPELEDPRSGSKLIERTVIIANVSNMPVSAREASIYMGVTIGEFYRDMGYDVAIMADSTSRWAEALRDISGRLEEIPAEAGFPAYLSDRIAQIYERTGRGVVMGDGRKLGSLTLIGAVSPPGGDFSEPVTTHTLRFIGTFWALDTDLAYRRHFPAINWLRSFTRYLEVAARWWASLDPGWEESRTQALRLLEEASEIEETARIIGEKALPDEQRLVLLLAEMLREGFLVQSAFHDVDTYCEAEKQTALLKVFIEFYTKVDPLVKSGVPIEQVREMDIVTELMRLKERAGVEPIEQASKAILRQRDALAERYEVKL
ncbi:V-type ATP synthase subunit A [Candidatus Bathyarchaeota archaeon]|jgi:V/A-type H+-transporting ATPase subunit A|nr:V-type ATP synthase subunit A [Candidatus Bathyarchaeota archaeon]MDP6048904.1 V-type ATP synthase subunit A [Candidatus Bathyarchaeota archaeon]MDP7207330.1 V-type ATP synthase subunit A [Candidatus Bathyarchaeota archaeon]|tara:strand:+ start:10456 stop:12219 length:1764 start_codon:yes stop_codon:yes gene_type:complete